MVTVKMRGREIGITPTTNSFSRRTQQFENKIIAALKKLGVHEDDIEVSEEKMPIKKASAWTSWYYIDSFCFLSHCRQQKYVDNLQVIARLIELEVEDVLNDEKTVDEFMLKFKEEDNILELRKEDRKLLELPEDCMDIELINKQYKQLSKAAHPDIPGGDVEKFKRLNAAHKRLKRELD